MDWGGTQEITIANGATTSGAFRTGPYHHSLAIQFATFTGATVTFHGSDSPDGTFVEIVNSSGTAISWTATNNKVVYGTEDQTRAILACSYVKVVSAGAEAAERTLIVYMK